MILAEIRKLGAASRPEIARRVALTPQAANGIFGELMDAGLIREGGKRGGSVGHPSTLYAISSAGAYAIGIKIGPRDLEATLVNFHGQMVYRAVTEFAESNGAAMGSAVAAGIEAVLSYARGGDIDLDRIVGMGIIGPEGPDGIHDGYGGPPSGVKWWDEAAFTGALPEGLDIPIYFERLAVAGALSMAMLSNMPLPPSYLYVTVGEIIDSCLVIEGEVRRGDHWRAGRFGAMPVGAGVGRAVATLGEVVTYAALRSRLAEKGFHAAGAEGLYRALHEHPGIVERWSGEAGDALFVGLQAIQACLDLGCVCLCIDPPNAVGDRLLERVRSGLERLPGLGLAVPTLQRDYPLRGSLAVGAAIVALHERFAPKLEEPAGGRRRPADGGRMSALLVQ